MQPGRSATRYLVDPDVLIQVLAGHPATLELLESLADDDLAIGWPTLGELYEGAFGMPDADAHLDALRGFVARFPVVDLNDAIMERFGRLRSDLRRGGRIIPDFDILLAATALHYDMTVLSYDRRHLPRVPGLRRYPSD